MQDPVAERLRELVAQTGPAIVDDPRRARALLADVLPDRRRETSLLVAAVEENVARDLSRDGGQTPPSTLRHQLEQRLSSERGISAEGARWAVAAWSYALGLPQAGIPEAPPPPPAAGANVGAETIGVGGFAPAAPLNGPPPAPVTATKRSASQPLLLGGLAGAAALAAIVLILVNFVKPPTPTPTGGAGSTATPVATTPAPPTASQTPLADMLPPQGGSIVIDDGRSYTTATTVAVNLVPPADPSGITHFLLDDGVLRPSIDTARVLVGESTFEISGGSGGERMLYAWFRDGSGNWSNTPVSDSIVFQHAPVASTGVEIAFHQPCNKEQRLTLLTHPDYPIATDLDAGDLLTIVQVWTGDPDPSSADATDLTHLLTADKREMLITLTGATSASNDVIDYFVVTDQWGEQADGWFRLKFGDC